MFSEISVAEIVGQAAGSTLGMFAGAHLVSGVAASLGATAGPIGMVLGGLLGGQLGVWAMRGLKGLVSGEGSPMAAVLGGQDSPATPEGADGNLARLPASALFPAGRVNELQVAYSATYKSWMAAEKSGDRTRRDGEFKKLTALKKDYELAVRTAMSAPVGHVSPR